jgi:hypothetical protein
MKRLLLTIALVAAATFANAQGTIQFGPNNPITRYKVNGVFPAGSTAGGPAAGTYVFGAFWGTTENNLALAAGPLATNTAVGGVLNVASGNAYQLANSEAGTTVFVQIRGWEARFGRDFAAGAAGGLSGSSRILPVLLGPSSGPGTVIWAANATDLTKFQSIDLVPEPSTIALAVLGLGSLLLFRRRK